MLRIGRRLLSSEGGAIASTLRVHFASPTAVIARGIEAHQVDLSTATDGDVGVLAGHVPAVLQLRPGVVRVRDRSGADLVPPHFVAGGFAQAAQDGAALHIAAYDAAPLAHFDAQAVARGVENTATASADESADTLKLAENVIHAEVYTAIANALQSHGLKSSA